ncbi:MAG: imidazole glycerol phosphate synthase subunit HisH [Thermoplasmatota archaeon]
MIGVVDYGLGNVQAFVHAYKRLGVPAQPVKTPGELAAADRIILPGVGAFDWAMERLDASGLRPALDAIVRGGRPVLGVCVGMQMMARGSEEGRLPGLAWVGADVKRLSPNGHRPAGDAVSPGPGRVGVGPPPSGATGDPPSGALPIALPHMGWNDVTARDGSRLLGGLPGEARFYFLHSFYFAPESDAGIAGTTEYGIRFCSAFESGNVWGVQFHPEKSHQWGLAVLKNFAEA